MTADLTTFLRARLDEDEQTARAAHRPNWSTDGRRGLHYGVEDGWMADALTTADADHIARHDPARVLREVEAKRRVLRAHEKWCEGRCEAKYPDGGFDAAHYWSIKSLAAVYADHPDYRQEWTP